MNYLSENIRRKRLDQHLSLAELAKRMGNRITRSTISRWELGQNEPRLSDIESLAGALGTNPAELVGWTETRND